jgi:hypothetical protein
MIFGSLEAAARFGGRLGLRQQANLREDQGPTSDSFHQRLDEMADPQARPTPELRPESLTQWGRCGLIRSSTF